MNNEIKFISPFKRLCVTVGNLPTAYMESMSYYECITFLVKFLTNEVVPTVNNNSEVVKELQDYVAHYFDNLDVQEEINNKLDEMAQEGELVSIIGEYLSLNSIISFNTLDDLKDGNNLINGLTARILGNTENDKTGAYYKIRELEESDTIDEYNLISLTNYPELVGERIYETIITSPINVKYYGAKGDGITDDSTIIQNIIDNNPKRTLYFPSGNYLLKSGIKVQHKYPVSFKLESDSKLFTDTAITCLIDLATDRTSEDYFNIETDPYITHIDGGVINCDNTIYGIRTQSSGSILYMNNVRLENVDNYGIYINRDEYYNSSNANLCNLVIRGKNSSSSNASTGICLKGYDNKLMNIFIFGNKIGLDIQSNGNFINTVHNVTYFGSNNVYTTSQFNNTIGFSIDGVDNNLINCYADTFGVGYLIKTNYQTTLNNCFTYWWQASAESITYSVKFDSVYQPKTKIVNCNFKLAPDGTKYIIYNTGGNNNIILDNNSYDKNIEATDLAFNTMINKNVNSVVPFETPATQLTPNSYYFIGYVKRDSFTTLSFDITYANAFKYSISLFYSSNGISFRSIPWFTGSLDSQLVVADPIEYNSEYYAKLYLKTGSETIWSQITFSNISGDLNIIPYHAKTTSSTPDTVLDTFDLE